VLHKTAVNLQGIGLAQNIEKRAFWLSASSLLLLLRVTRVSACVSRTLFELDTKRH